MREFEKAIDYYDKSQLNSILNTSEHTITEGMPSLF